MYVEPPSFDELLVTLRSLFPDASETVLAPLIEEAEVGRYEDVSVGCPPGRALIVLSGRLLRLSDPFGKKMPIEALEPGDYWEAVPDALESVFFFATASTLTITVAQDRMHESLRTDPGFSAAVRQRMNRRLDAATRRMTAAFSKPGRVWAVLDLLATPDGAGQRSVTISRIQLRAWVGMSERAISLVFKLLFVKRCITRTSNCPPCYVIHSVPV